MRVKKEPIDQERLRCIPRGGFSWIDRRFVREGFCEQLPPEAILVYFFLAAVSDAKGLSFYADPTVERLLKLDQQQIVQARGRLVDANLVLYRYPIYQVLPLPERLPPSRGAPPRRAASRSVISRDGEPLRLEEILALAAENSRQRRAEPLTTQHPTAVTSKASPRGDSLKCDEVRTKAVGEAYARWRRVARSLPPGCVRRIFEKLGTIHPKLDRPEPILEAIELAGRLKSNPQASPALCGTEGQELEDKS